MSKYSFKFGYRNDWFKKDFEAVGNLFEAHGDRTDKMQILYIFNDDDLWGMVELSQDLYAEFWEVLNAKYNGDELVEAVSGDRPGHKIYNLLDHFRRDASTMPMYYEASNWLEQGYLKHALSHHQTAAGLATAGPEDTEGSHRGATAQT